MIQKKSIAQHIIVRLPEIPHKYKIQKADKEKKPLISTAKSMRITDDILAQSQKSRRA